MSDLRNGDTPDGAFDAAIDPAFDADLRAMFADSAPPEHDPAFTARVTDAIQPASSARSLTLGAAGAAGAAIAATQIDSLLALMAGQADLLGGLASTTGPELLVVGAFAGLAMVFARVLPASRGYA